VPARQAHKFTIKGKPWRWLYRSLRRRKLCGLCNWTAREVTICTSVDGLERLDTEIHEALHAMQEFASEEHTTEVASTLATILWQLGYRLTEERNGRG